MNRRHLLQTAAAAAGHLALGSRLHGAEPTPRKRLAAVNSIYYKLSHAYHIVGRMIYGYTVKGEHHQPAYDVVRMFNHQYFAEGKFLDISRPLARRHGIQLTNSIAEALGGPSSLDVEGVLLIVEHGDYPRNGRNQILYPRAEFFDQIVSVFKASGRTVPVFCDKHLSYDHALARKMYDTAKAMGFGLMAGSSLPVTWRRPEWEPDLGARIEEVVVCFGSDLEIYGLHALEVLQCLAERRKGGETGVRSVTALTGDAVWKAWDRGDWSKELADAALRHSPSRDYGTPRDHVELPTAFRVEYLDGTHATLLHLPGYIADLTAAVKVAGEPKPHATWFVLPIPPGARFFNPLTYYIEKFFATGKSPYPVERTLLTTTMLDFAMRSASEGGEVYRHPAMKIEYQPAQESFYFRGPTSDE